MSFCADRGIFIIVLHPICARGRSMPISSPNWKHPFSTSCITLILGSCSIAPAVAQQTPPAPPTAYHGEKSEAAHAESDKRPTAGTRPAESMLALKQLNTAIEQLPARISPAVVQILVTGYGAVEESGQGRTALVAREQAIRSGHRRSQRLHRYQCPCRCL